MTLDARPAMTDARRRPAPWASAIGWAGVLLLAMGASVQAASRPVEVENLWLGFGSSNSFKVGTWTPVWVQLRGGDERFEGFMEVVVADDDGTPTSYFTRVDVGAKASQRFTAYVRPGARDPDLTIRLYDRNQPAGGHRAAGRSAAAAARGADAARDDDPRPWGSRRASRPSRRCPAFRRAPGRRGSPPGPARRSW